MQVVVEIQYQYMKMQVKQMDIYAENNTKIKELREELIDINSSRWWLYFGGNK